MNDFQRKLLIRLGGSFVVSMALIGLLFYVGGDIHSINESIQSIRSGLIARSQAIGNLAGLRNDAEEAKKGVSALQNALPARESLFVFSDEINRLAGQRSLSSNFIFGAEIAGSSGIPGRMEFTANVAGEYDNIIDFIKAFESSRYFTSIKSLEMVSQGANTTGYQAIISGEVFYKSN